MEIKKVMVVGVGQMGQEIAQVCATGGADVYLYDISDDIVCHCKEGYRGSKEFGG